MSRLIGLHHGLYKGVADRIDSLRKACANHNWTFVDVDSSIHQNADVWKLSDGDAVYNLARGGEVFETRLLGQTALFFYRERPLLVENNGDTTKYITPMEQAGLSVPKTCFISNLNVTQLQEEVHNLGGFPIVVKVPGGTLGVGVLLIESFPSLMAFLELGLSQYDGLYLRSYIEPKEVARLIVVGNEVVAANQKLIPPNDFRTSVQFHPPVPKEYNSDINRLAIQASVCCNFANCGVDILIDHQDKPYVLEVNMPHDFTTSEKATGVDIAGLMIKYLKTMK